MSVKISQLPSAETLDVTDYLPISKYQGESKKITYGMIVSDMNTRHGSYNSLMDKPSINSVPLQGDLTLEQIGIFPISSASIDYICT